MSRRAPTFHYMPRPPLQCVRKIHDESAPDEYTARTVRSAMSWLWAGGDAIFRCIVDSDDVIVYASHSGRTALGVSVAFDTVEHIGVQSGADAAEMMRLLELELEVRLTYSEDAT